MQAFLFRFCRFLEDRDQWVVGGLIGVLVYAGILYSFYLQDVLRYFDERHYYAVAEMLADSGQYVNNMTSGASAFRPIGYPAVLSAAIFFGAEAVVSG